jgi:hypothetical protein
MAKSTLDLLKKLAEGRDITETIEALKRKPEVTEALRKADGAIVVRTNDGKIDPQATANYIEKLARPFGKPQRKVNDQFPMSLEEACGQNHMVTINPITNEIVYVGEEDEYGVDISKLPDERYYALVWAAMFGHRFWPKSMEEFEVETYLEEIFAEKPNRRWTQIFEDYEQAKARGDLKTTQLIPRRLSERQALELLKQFGGKTAASLQQPAVSQAPNYEALVRGHAQLYPATIRVRASGNNVTRSICEELHLSASGCSVQGTIVLDGGHVNGSGNYIQVYMPPRKDLRNDGSANEIHITNLPWKQLAEKLGLA